VVPDPGIPRYAVVSHRIRARRAASASPPPIERDPAVVASFLSDAAHVPGGFAAGVATPRNVAEMAALVATVDRVLPVGAQSSLTCGATPRGEVVVSTRALTAIGQPASDTVRAGAGVPLATLQRTLTASGLYYPPVPTFDGAFVGGTIATNAAGAATFKYGSTRDWVSAIAVVIASGELLEIERGSCTASPEGWFEIESAAGHVERVPVPGYRMPAVAKLSAGYFARPAMDLIDLFIGSEGTLGIIVEAELRLVPRPRRLLALVHCEGDGQAIALTGILRNAAAGRSDESSLDVSAIEYVDARALRAVPDEAFARAQVPRPGPGSVLLLVQVVVPRDDDGVLVRFNAALAACGVAGDPIVAAPADERAAERLFGLREAVPASVNALVAAAKARSHPTIEKTAADPVVPFSRLAESIALYRSAFETRGLDYAIWGHVSDGNLHPNVIPRTLDDMHRGREAILEIARGVVAMGGAPLAEHGVGRSPLKQRLLRELYSDEGIRQMLAVKEALDPTGKLAPGVVLPSLGTGPSYLS
jgi:D-lactate dehydrogenase (cytochrome)